jgi:dUTPase
VGIIDSGYRGNIGAYFDCIRPDIIEYGQRLVQICGPTLEPFYIVLSNHLSNTERGANGFGSTGV